MENENTETKESFSEAELPKLTKKQLRQQKKQNQKMKQFFTDYKKSQRHDKLKLKKKLKVLEYSLGKLDFQTLESICTITTEEKKDENGNVVTPKSSKVNYNALFVEGRLAIALNREARIKAGKRKKTTGRSSDRTTHNNTVKFINNRNKKLSQSNDA